MIGSQHAAGHLDLLFVEPQHLVIAIGLAIRGGDLHPGVDGGLVMDASVPLDVLGAPAGSHQRPLCAWCDHLRQLALPGAEPPHFGTIGSMGAAGGTDGGSGQVPELSELLELEQR